MRPEFSFSEHEEIIKQSEDIPETKPLFPFPINRVGITGKTLWVHLPQGLIPLDAEVFVDLPEEYKGIHMSRMEQAISKLAEKSFENICQYCHQLAHEILKKQKARLSHVKLRGRLPYTSNTIISNRPSSDTMDVYAETVLSPKTGSHPQRHVFGLGLAHITACPCTQVYNKGLFAQDRVPFPYPTHSQRCTTWLEIETYRNEHVSLEDLFSSLASCLHLSQDLLKRPDEAELVLKSHRKPQFAEDVVRLVAKETAKRFRNKIHHNSLVRIKTTSLESIHRHDVSCLLEASLGAIVKRL